MKLVIAVAMRKEAKMRRCSCFPWLRITKNAPVANRIRVKIVLFIATTNFVMLADGFEQVSQWRSSCLRQASFGCALG
jgi:hypothetical protein